jgi:hypothetical protein
MFEFVQLYTFDLLNLLLKYNSLLRVLAMKGLLAIFCCVAVFIQNSHATPLDDYVNQFDANYKFDVLDWSYKGEGYTLFCINMTSQKWLTGSFL